MTEILKDSGYQDIVRLDMFKDVFVSASVNSPSGNAVNGLLKIDVSRGLSNNKRGYKGIEAIVNQAKYFAYSTASMPNLKGLSDT